jgi:hypothetical protein
MMSDGAKTTFRHARNQPRPHMPWMVRDPAPALDRLISWRWAWEHRRRMPTRHRRRWRMPRIGDRRA